MFSVNPNEAFNNSLLNTYKSNHETVAFFHPPFIIMYRKLHAFACRLVYNVPKSQCLQGEEQNALNTSYLINKEDFKEKKVRKTTY